MIGIEAIEVEAIVVEKIRNYKMNPSIRKTIGIRRSTEIEAIKETFHLLSDLGIEPGDNLLIAIKDNQMVGVVAGFGEDICVIEVLESYRGLGIAKLLIQTYLGEFGLDGFNFVGVLLDGYRFLRSLGQHRAPTEHIEYETLDDYLDLQIMEANVDLKAKYFRGHLGVYKAAIRRGLNQMSINPIDMYVPDRFREEFLKRGRLAEAKVLSYIRRVRLLSR